MRALRRFTRTALLFSAGQWAWQHRDEIKREIQPVIDKGQAFLREQQAKRSGKPVVVPVVEHPTASTHDLRRDAALVG
jgi:hypothetical protein